MLALVAAVAGVLTGWFLLLVAPRLVAHERLLPGIRHAWPRRSRHSGLVAGLTPLLFVVVALMAERADRLLTGLLLASLLVAVTLTDLEHRVIPDRLTGAAAGAGLAVLVATDPGRLPEHVAAAAAAGGFLLLAALARPGGMGLGDVKLAAVLGLLLGWAVVPGLLIALASGTVAGLAVIARRGIRRGRGVALPLGPFLATGGLLALLAEWSLPGGAPVLPG